MSFAAHTDTRVIRAARRQVPGANEELIKRGLAPDPKAGTARPNTGPKYSDYAMWRENRARRFDR